MSDQRYEPRKLQELIVYIAEKSADDRFFGMTKLNKILFYADFTAYRERGASITGAKYQHLPQGPCPQQLLPAMKALADGVVVQEESTYVGTRRKVIATRKADRTIFERDDLTSVDEILDELGPLNSAQVSDMSHGTMAWRLTEKHQEIPYGTAYLDEAEPSDEDIEWLMAVSRGAALASSS